MTTAAPVQRRPTPRFLLVAEYYATLFRHFWRGSIVTILVSPIFYLLAMGLGVGSLVDANSALDSGRALAGASYLSFVAPGMMAAASMQTAVGGSLYPVMASVKWLRTAHGVAATPIRPSDIALGLQTWLAVQMLVAATVFVAIMALFGVIGAGVGDSGVIQSWWVVAAPPAAALGGLAYSAPLTAWSVGRESDDSFSLIFRFGVLPSFLLSGTFFPISQLPVPLRALAAISPLWHSVDLARGFTSGRFEPATVAIHLVVLSAYVAVGLALARREYGRRLHP